MNPAQTKRFRLGYAVDGQDHVELAFCQAKLADIGMDVSDWGCGQLALFRGLIRALGQPGDTVALKAAVETGAGELWDAVTQAAQRQTLRVSAGTS